jgi:hypothetical protein
MRPRARKLSFGGPRRILAGPRPSCNAPTPTIGAFPAGGHRARASIDPGAAGYRQFGLRGQPGASPPRRTLGGRDATNGLDGDSAFTEGRRHRARRDHLAPTIWPDHLGEPLGLPPPASFATTGGAAAPGALSGTPCGLRDTSNPEFPKRSPEAKSLAPAPSVQPFAQTHRPVDQVGDLHTFEAENSAVH